MLLEILIGLCVFIVLLGVGAIVFFNEKEAKKQRSERVEQALTITIGRQEFDTQVQALMHANAEAVRKAGLVKAPAPEPRLPKVTQATPRKPHTGGYVSQAPDRSQRDADYLTSVAIASSYDNTPSSRTCSSSSSSHSSYSSCSGSSSSSSSSDSGSSSSGD